MGKEDKIFFNAMPIKTSPPLIEPKIAGSPMEMEEKGGIDLSKIELTLKDEKYMSSLNPADVKVLRAAKALKDQWDSPNERGWP
jgi:hypothetical protein